MVLAADDALLDSAATVVTYGRGVHWAQEAAKAFPGRIELVDLRTFNLSITRALRRALHEPTAASC